MRAIVFACLFLPPPPSSASVGKLGQPAVVHGVRGGQGAQSCSRRLALEPPFLSHFVAHTAGKYGMLGALRTLLVSYFCNLAGALMLVGLMSGGEVFTNRWAGRGCGTGSLPSCLAWLRCCKSQQFLCRTGTVGSR